MVTRSVRLGCFAFALIGLAPLPALVAGCVYRPLPLPAPPGGAGQGGSGGAGTGGFNSGSGGAAEVADAGPSEAHDARPDSPDVRPDVLRDVSRDVSLDLAPPAPPPRLLAPLSTATVTSQRATLRWELAGNTDGAHVQICRDRACAVEVTSFDAAGASGQPPRLLPAGVLFWRAFGRAGGVTGSAPSPTWEMIVGARSAPVDASWGTTLDVNGDGYADVIVGSDAVDNYTGRAYLYLGGANGLPSMPSAALSGPDGANGYFGASVASAGDVDGDGYADVIIGAYNVDGQTGRAYLYLGGPAGLASSPAAALTGPAGQGGSFGISVAGAGDVNGDGYADVVVGADEANAFRGQAYLYLGGAAGLAAAPAATLDGPDGEFGSFGYSVAGAGDVNGDGYADVVVGANEVSDDDGKAYLYLGGAAGLASAPSTTLVGPTGELGQFGLSVASAGDVNGDGYADVVIGADSAAEYGQAYLYLGGAAGLAGSSTTTLTASGNASGFFGGQVASAGDVDGDGYSDVIVGTYGLMGAYLFLGGAAGLSVSPAAALALPAPASGGFAVSVAGAGDVDGDGHADLIVGVPAFAFSNGHAYLFSGAAGPALIFTSPTVTLASPDADDSGGFAESVAAAEPPISSVPRSNPMRSSDRILHCVAGEADVDRRHFSEFAL